MKHKIELIAWVMAEWVFNALPLDRASALGGAIARGFGRFSRRSRIAEAQLAHFLPELTADERKQMVRNMWDNLGRTVAEFTRFPDNELLARITLTGKENFVSSNIAAVYVTAHIGNWELLPSLPHAHGTPMVVGHRRASNPLTAARIEAKRLAYAKRLAPKNAQGVAEILRAIKEKRPVGMLTDQRISTGISRLFMGKPAFISSLPAELAVKYGAAVIPAYIIRKNGCHFEAVIEPALRWDPSGNASADIERITDMINLRYEAWIRAHPEQWLWFHERWGKGVFKAHSARKAAAVHPV